MFVPKNRRLGKVAAPLDRQIMLLPGQLFFGNTPKRIRTLLGSCVAITLWRPGTCIGGMCHYLLPRRGQHDAASASGRYGDDAIAMLLHAIEKSGSRPEQFEAQVYGGADTMSGEHKSRFNIGVRNVEQAWQMIDECNFSLESVDVGGNCPRTVTLDLGSGRVELRRGDLMHQKIKEVE